MAIVRLEAMRALQEALEHAAPDLAGHVITTKAMPGKDLCIPTLVIDPIRFTYLPDAAHEFYEPDPNHVVMCVGRFEVLVQLRLVADTQYARMELEEQVLAAFLGYEDHPGVLLTQVVACRDFGPFVAAWELDEDSWSDERIFDKQLWAVATLTGVIPALVTREAPTITDLRIALTQDFATTFDSTTVETSSAVDVVRVNEDGSLTPVS